MVQILVSLSRFSIMFLMAIYVYDCFLSLRSNTNKIRAKFLNFAQRFIVFMIILNGNLVLYLVDENIEILYFMLAEFVLFIFIIWLYRLFYPKASVVLLNNMLLLLGIGLLMLERLSFEKAIRQFAFAVIGIIITCFIPFLIAHLKRLERYSIIFAIAGIIGLLVVLITASTTYGAKLNITIAGIAIQPSEFIKISFVLFAAGYLYKDTSLERVVRTSILAALHVLILVASRDLGGALLFLITFLVILYVSSRQPLYMVLGLMAGAVAAVMSYFMFSHVRTRVIAWLDPLSVIDNEGYQVCQSLFAISAGGWIGTGIGQGMPEKIPVVTTDFIFSAICEELGAIFALCVILVFICSMLMIFNISIRIRDKFYKLVALGLGCMFATQSLLSLGGVIKFIPSTGVTLPFISYGGSSLFSTIIIFAMIQGLYIKHSMEVI